MKSVIRVGLFLLLVFWMSLIFAFSADDATESAIKSSDLSYKIAQIFVDDFEDMIEEEQKAILEEISFPLRKTAHFCIFSALSVITFFNLYFFEKLTIRFKYGVSFIFASLYAASDEIHQKFVPGRSCEFCDWFIDSCGVAVGLLLCFILLYFWQRKKRRGYKDEKKTAY